MKSIYQMSYEEFKKLCWNKWGIMVTQTFIQDVNGKIVDHRSWETIIKLPTINEDGTIDLINTTDIRFRRLRDTIEYVSKKRKNELMKPYFKALEREMSKVYGEKKNG